MKKIKLRTICEAELWAGFFGVDANGTQPECVEEITLEVDPDEVEYDEDGVPRPSYSVECPRCHTMLSWPQYWEIIDKTE